MSTQLEHIRHPRQQSQVPDKHLTLSWQTGRQYSRSGNLYIANLMSVARVPARLRVAIALHVDTSPASPQVLGPLQTTRQKLQSRCIHSQLN